MKGLKHNWVIGVIFIACSIFVFHMSFADDTCLFTTDGRFYTFTAPVVPESKTTSSNRVYLAFFRPGVENFWAGNVVKFAINEENQIVDANNRLALEEDNEESDIKNAMAIKKDAVPFWATIGWADHNKTNYIRNSDRHIYTYLGSSRDLTAPANAFISSNGGLTPAVLGNPTHNASEIIDYIRGADVFDENDNSETAENRSVITGDIQHSEPLVIDYEDSLRVVYYGANDGMLHAVKDSTLSTPASDDGKEMWAFIPPDQLHRLKDIVEGESHQYYVDSSPKVYIKDVNENGIIEVDVDSDEDGDVDDDDKDRAILVCGERKGGTSYFALDVTDPFAPVFLWRINQYEDTAELSLPLAAGPDVIIPELGESWPEPQFGLVKTSDADTVGTPVFFIGGGYSSDTSAGKAVITINVFDGTVEKKFSGITGMNYSIPSSVTVIDADSNGFVDKVYVGDLGSQMWRFGNLDPSNFPDIINENINSWAGQIIFRAGCGEASCTNVVDDNKNGVVDEWRKFFYPPSVVLEWGYDLVFMGTGDREDPCNPISSDRIYAVKDTHVSITLDESDLVNVTNTEAPVPDLNKEGDVDGNGLIDQGWYILLAKGEKVLSEGVVFLKTYYVTTFSPEEGGKLYALNYKTGEAVYGSLRVKGKGGGLLSKPVVVINKTDQKLLVSAGAINPGGSGTESVGPGILAIEPSAPPANFFYLWWREL